MISYSNLKTMVLNLIFPHFCAGCGKEGTALCHQCEVSLMRSAPACFVCRKWTLPSKKTPRGKTCASCKNKTSIYAFISPFSYKNDTMRSIIHDLKYSHVRSHAFILAEMVYKHIQAYSITLPDGARIIPIPLYSGRRRTRGFNQSELIARHLAEFTQIKIDTTTLKKIKDTKSQVELSAAERLTNLSESFAVEDPSQLAGRNIILLDDIKTTGATLEEAARTLKKAGAKKIWAITIAH